MSRNIAGFWEESKEPEYYTPPGSLSPNEIEGSTNFTLINNSESVILLPMYDSRKFKICEALPQLPNTDISVVELQNKTMRDVLVIASEVVNCVAKILTIHDDPSFSAKYVIEPKIVCGMDRVFTNLLKQILDAYYDQLGFGTKWNDAAEGKIEDNEAYLSLTISWDVQLSDDLA